VSKKEYPNGAVSDDSIIDEGAILHKNTRATKSHIGKWTTVGDNSIIGYSDIGDYVAINRGNLISASRIGLATYTGHNTTIKNTQIGKFCCLSWNLSLGGKNHNYRAVTSYPEYHFNRIINGRSEIIISNLPDTVIGNDVWIGSNANVLRGVVVGDGAVIGASAIVTRNVPPYAIVAGNPARIIKYRFDDNIICELLELKWWDFDLKDIKEMRNFLENEPTYDQIKEIKGKYKH